MNHEEIISKANKIIVEHLGVEEEKVVRDADFADDLGADSLDMVELVMAFEEEFNIEVRDDEMEKAESVGAAYDLLISKVAA